MADGDDVDLELLRESAREFLGGRGAKRSVDDLAAMDWTGLLVDESLGGAGWRPVEATVIAEELGRAQDGSPWLGCVVAGAALGAAPAEVRDRWLPALLAGTATVGLGAGGDVVRLIGGDEVDVLITLERNGIHILERSEAWKCWRGDELLDVTRAAWYIDFSGAPSALIGSPELADRLRAVARVLISADSIGAFSVTLGRLVTYLKDRLAFGAPIASFQAVQHRLVELLVIEVKARAIVMRAARALAADDDSATKLSAVAHAYVAAKATAAVDECMQLSGGIGFTWEYPLHHELRRVFTNAQLLGTARSSRALLAEVSGW
jgi:alkylation response protein AidB-like acyl-CoA dehydrogenase